jgi:hypothetical protein
MFTSPQVIVLQKIEMFSTSASIMGSLIHGIDFTHLTARPAMNPDVGAGVRQHDRRLRLTVARDLIEPITSAVRATVHLRHELKIYLDAPVVEGFCAVGHYRVTRCWETATIGSTHLLGGYRYKVLLTVKKDGSKCIRFGKEFYSSRDNFDDLYPSS